MRRSASPSATRRRFLRTAGALGLLSAFARIAPAYAQSAPGRAGELRVGGDGMVDLVGRSGA